MKNMAGLLRLIVWGLLFSLGSLPARAERIYYDVLLVRLFDFY
jgi:hypothetical protein